MLNGRTNSNRVDGRRYGELAQDITDHHGHVLTDGFHEPAIRHTVRSCPLKHASSAYENDTAASVIATRIDGVANLVERCCAADMAV